MRLGSLWTSLPVCPPFHPPLGIPTRRDLAHTCCAWAWTVLDTMELADIFALRMPSVFSLMLEDKRLLNMSAFLLGLQPGDLSQVGGLRVPRLSR